MGEDGREREQEKDVKAGYVIRRSKLVAPKNLAVTHIFGSDMMLQYLVLSSLLSIFCI